MKHLMSIHHSWIVQLWYVNFRKDFFVEYEVDKAKKLNAGI